MQGKVIRDETGELQCVIMNSGVSVDNLQLLVKRILSVAVCVCVCYCSVALLFSVCVAFVVCCVLLFVVCCLLSVFLCVLLCCSVVVPFLIVVFSLSM